MLFKHKIVNTYCVLKYDKEIFLIFDDSRSFVKDYRCENNLNRIKIQTKEES